MKTWIQNLEQDVTEKMDEATKKRIAGRRMIWLPVGTLNLLNIRVAGKMANKRKYMLLWIDRHTTGNFYLGGSQIGFADEKDELIFKLWFRRD